MSFITGLLTLMELSLELIRFFEDNFGAEWKKYAAEATSTFKKLNEAETKEQKIEAAKSLQNLFHLE